MLITNDRPVSWYFIYKTQGGIPKRVLLSPGQQLEIPEITTEEQIVFKAYDRKVREINNRLKRAIPERTINPDRKVFIDSLRGIDSYIDLTRFLSSRISFISEFFGTPELTTLYSKTTNLSVGTQLYVKDNIYGTGKFYRLGQTFIATNDDGESIEINSWSLSNSLAAVPAEGSLIGIFTKDELTSYRIDFTKGVITSILKKSDKGTEKPKPEPPEPVSHIDANGRYTLTIAPSGSVSVFFSIMTASLDLPTSLTLEGYNLSDEINLTNISLARGRALNTFDFTADLVVNDEIAGEVSIAGVSFNGSNAWVANKVSINDVLYDVTIQYSTNLKRV